MVKISKVCTKNFNSDYKTQNRTKKKHDPNKFYNPPSVVKITLTSELKLNGFLGKQISRLQLVTCCSIIKINDSMVLIQIQNPLIDPLSVFMF